MRRRLQPTRQPGSRNQPALPKCYNQVQCGSLTRRERGFFCLDCRIALLPSMSRIRKGYEHRFREILRRSGARRLDEGVRWLLRHAEALSSNGDLPPEEALALVSQKLLQTLHPRQSDRAIHFLCDGGLGGLAR